MVLAIARQCPLDVGRLNMQMFNPLHLLKLHTVHSLSDCSPLSVQATGLSGKIY